MGLLAVITPWRRCVRIHYPMRLLPQSRRLTTGSTIAGTSGPPPPWSNEDVQRLLSMKAESKPTAEILAAFPGRSLAAIAVKWSKVTPRGQSGRPSYASPDGKYFTHDEKEKIVELRQKGVPFSKIQQEHFPTRSVQGLRKAHNSTVWFRSAAERRHAKWSMEEEQKLLDLRLNQKMDVRAAARELGRSYNAVAERWSQIVPTGVSKRTANAIRADSFTPMEDDQLLEMYGTGMRISQISAAFPAHSQRRLQNRIFYLKKRGERDAIYLRRPLEIRKQILEKLRQMAIQGMSFKEMAAQLPDIPEKTLQNYFSRLDPEFKAAAAKRNFSTEDDELISRMARESASAPSIQRALNGRFSRWHIKNRILHLGLRDVWRSGPHGIYKLFTPDDDKIIMELSEKGETREQIRSKLNNKFSLFQLRRRIKILEERESFKAKRPLHWVVRTRAEAEAAREGFKEGYKIEAGTAEADEKTMRMAHSGKKEDEIMAQVGYPSLKALRERLRKLRGELDLIVDQRLRKPDREFAAQDDDLIAEMYESGATLEDINSALRWKFTYRAVQGRIRTLHRTRGIRRPRWAREQMQIAAVEPAAITPRDENLIKMYQDDATDQEIIHALGVPSETALRQWVRDLRIRKGVKLPRRASNLSGGGRSAYASRRPSAKPLGRGRRRKVFDPEDDEKLIKLVQEHAPYRTMVAAFHSKYSPYLLRIRRAELGFPDESRRGRVKGDRSPSKPTRIPGPAWSLSENDKENLLRLRDQGLTWQEMAAQVPAIPAEVVQDFYFYGRQEIKLRSDGTLRAPRKVSGRERAAMVDVGEEDGNDSREHDQRSAENAEKQASRDAEEQPDEDEHVLENEADEDADEEFEKAQDAWEEELENVQDDEGDDLLDTNDLEEEAEFWDEDDVVEQDFEDAEHHEEEEDEETGR